jgi:hypothetical protein
VSVLLDMPCDIFAALLTQASGALFSAPALQVKSPWPLYTNSMPDGQGVPEELATAYDTEGVVVDRFLASGQVVEAFGIQLKTRAFDPRAGRAVLSQASDFLSAVKRQPVTVTTTIDGVTQSNAYTVDTVKQTSSVIPAGQDEKRRAFHTVNFLLLLLNH